MMGRLMDLDISILSKPIGDCISTISNLLCTLLWATSIIHSFVQSEHTMAM